MCRVSCGGRRCWCLCISITLPKPPESPSVHLFRRFGGEDLLKLQLKLNRKTWPPFLITENSEMLQNIKHLVCPSSSKWNLMKWNFMRIAAYELPPSVETPAYRNYTFSNFRNIAFILKKTVMEMLPLIVPGIDLWINKNTKRFLKKSIQNKLNYPAKLN